MKSKPLFALAGLTAALGLSLVVPSADAQGRRGGGPGGGGPGGAGGPGGGGPGQNGQLNTLQLQMQMQMGTANIVDPAVSAKTTLIYRTDVQDALALDLKQKVALDALKEVQAQNQGKMGLTLRTLAQGLRGPGSQNLSADDQQKKMQDAVDQAKGMAQGYQDDLEKRIDALLTPKQQQRLGEIDLQWRGPLSLVDSKVAEKATLNDADKKKAADTYKEFTDARQKLMLAMMPSNMRSRLASTGTLTAGATADSSTPPAAPTLPAVSLTPEEQVTAQKRAQLDFDKSCLAMSVKLMADVTPAAATSWQGMIGTHFTFRNIN